MRRRFWHGVAVGVVLTLVIGGVAAGVVYWQSRGATKQQLLEHGMTVGYGRNALGTRCANQQSYLWRCIVTIDQGGSRGPATASYMVRAPHDCFAGALVHEYETRDADPYALRTERVDITTPSPEHVGGWLHSRANCVERIAIK